MTFLRLLVLVVILNVLRYVIGGYALEPVLIFPGLGEAMAGSADYFNADFQTIDWVTSYSYNFTMWFICAWLFHLLRPVIAGVDVVASLKVFGILWVFFAAVCAILMNHYSHSKDFYFWIIVDGLLVYGIVAICNGLIYRKVMGDRAAAWPGDE